MFTRMPGFGRPTSAAGRDALGDGRACQPSPAVRFDDPQAKVKAAARHMVGEQALACIKCHTFNGVKAEGMQGIDMTLMPKRLQRDWYSTYLMDPQEVPAGTAHADRLHQ